MASVTDLGQGGRPLGYSVNRFIDIERRHGKDEMVIEKALVKD
jgi:hypothetical protein